MSGLQTMSRLNHTLLKRPSRKPFLHGHAAPNRQRENYPAVATPLYQRIRIIPNGIQGVDPVQSDPGIGSVAR